MREAWIDHARGLGMLLVMIGHAPAMPALLNQLLAAFRMPAFFFIAGLVVSDRRLAGPPREYFARLWRILVVPYLFFWGVSYLYWLATRRHAVGAARYADFDGWTPWQGLLMGIGAGIPFNEPLWFLTALASLSALYYLLRRRLDAYRVLLLSVPTSWAAASWFGASGMRWVWNLDVALSCLVFYAAGAALVGQRRGLRERLGVPRVALIAAGAALVLLVWSSMHNGRVDINRALYGDSALLFMLGGLCGIVAMLCAAVQLPRNRILAWISANTIVIAPTHVLLYSMFTGALVLGLGLAKPTRDMPGLGLLYVLAALLVMPVIVWLLRRYLPAAIGQRSDGSAQR